MLVGVLVTLTGLLLMMRSMRADQPQGPGRILLPALIAMLGVAWTIYTALAS